MSPARLQVNAGQPHPKIPRAVVDASKAPNPPNPYPLSLEPQDTEMKSPASPHLVENDSHKNTNPRAKKESGDTARKPYFAWPIISPIVKYRDTEPLITEPLTTAHLNFTSVTQATRATQKSDGTETSQKQRAQWYRTLYIRHKRRHGKKPRCKMEYGAELQAGDDAMEADPLSNIKSHHGEHIVNAILDCTLSYQQLVEKTNPQASTSNKKPGSMEMDPRPQSRAASKQYSIMGRNSSS